MTFFGHYGAGRTPPRAKHITSDVEVERRRLYAERRRQEAFKQQATQDDMERYDRERESGRQGRLAV